MACKCSRLEDSGGIYGNTQGFIRLRYGAKVHCLSRQASYALLVNGFNRQVISLVFPDYEAVSVSDFLYTSEHILYFTLFVFR